MVVIGEKGVFLSSCQSLVGNVVLRTNGFSYFCCEMRGVYALIKVFNGSGRVVCFEVWKLRPFHVSVSVRNSWGVRFPSSSEFGYYGWAFGLESNAFSFFNGLVRGGGL